MLAQVRKVPFHLRLSYLLPALLVLATWALVQTQPDLPRTTLAHMALFDATISTALLVWLLTPRAERGLPASLLVILRGVAFAALAFPELRQYLWLYALGLAVTGGYVLRGLRQPLPEGYAELDDLERLYAWCSRLAPSPRLARMVLFERTLFQHLLLRPRLPEGKHFGTRRGATTGATFTLLIFGSIVEGMLSHVLLERWSVAAAWIWTGLNVFGLSWLLAYGRALTLRPVTVGRRLYLRSGLHWTGSTPLVNVTAARPFDAAWDGAVLNIALDVKPNVTLSFHQPVHLFGLYGVEREVGEVTLHVDAPHAFLSALQAVPLPLSSPEILPLPLPTCPSAKPR